MAFALYWLHMELHTCSKSDFLATLTENGRKVVWILIYSIWLFIVVVSESKGRRRKHFPISKQERQAFRVARTRLGIRTKDFRVKNVTWYWSDVIYHATVAMMASEWDVTLNWRHLSRGQGGIPLNSRSHEIMDRCHGSINMTVLSIKDLWIIWITYVIVLKLTDVSRQHYFKDSQQNKVGSCPLSNDQIRWSYKMRDSHKQLSTNAFKCYHPKRYPLECLTFYHNAQSVNILLCVEFGNGPQKLQQCYGTQVPPVSY